MQTSDDPSQPSTTTIWPAEAYGPDGKTIEQSDLQLSQAFDYSLFANDQKSTYEAIGLPLLSDFWGPEGDGDGGFECCLLTMDSSQHSQYVCDSVFGQPDDQGLLPRIARAVVARVAALQNPPDTSLKVTCTMVEIYMDKVYDLLLPKKAMQKPRSERVLEIRMGQPFGATHIEVADQHCEEVDTCLRFV